MVDVLNPDGTVTLDSQIPVEVNKTVVPSELRAKRAHIKQQIAVTRANLNKLQEALAQVRAEIAACIAVGSPEEPGDNE
jgi:hypothetical protein